MNELSQVNSRSPFYEGNIPDEVILYIFSYLTKPEDLVRAGRVCKLWAAFTKDKCLWDALPMEKIYRNVFFSGKWKQLGVNIQDPARDNHSMISLLESPCPVAKNKAVKKTHILVLVGGHIQGALKKLNQKFPDENWGAFKIVVDEEVESENKEPRYVLITKNVVEGSTDKTFGEQEAFVNENYPGYEVSGLLETIICQTIKSVTSCVKTDLYARTAKEDNDCSDGFKHSFTEITCKNPAMLSNPGKSKDIGIMIMKNIKTPESK